MRAGLNGMMGRAGDAGLTLPGTLPKARGVGVEDAKLIAAAVDRNPELEALAHQVAGRKDALELAKMAYIPDVSPTAAVNGSVSQTLGAMVMIPTNLPQIKAAIEEAKAMLRSTEAMARQTRSDRGASFVGALYAMRNAERQVELLRQRIVPAARQVMESSRQAYATGAVGFADLIDSQRTLLDVRVMIVEAQVEREKRLVELESLAGVDVETLENATTKEASR